MDKFAAMKMFVRIVEAGSLTGAANSLDTSLPTVVRTLASLERSLGVSLLKRTTRRIHLTDEGTQYLERCRDILAAIQEAEDILVARRTEPVGKLSITASVAFGRRYLAPILYDFLQRHPKVTADVLFVDRVVNLIPVYDDIVSLHAISTFPTESVASTGSFRVALVPLSTLNAVLHVPVIERLEK